MTNWSMVTMPAKRVTPAVDQDLGAGVEETARKTVGVAEGHRHHVRVVAPEPDGARSSVARPAPTRRTATTLARSVITGFSLTPCSSSAPESQACGVEAVDGQTHAHHRGATAGSHRARAVGQVQRRADTRPLAVSDAGNLRRKARSGSRVKPRSSPLDPSATLKWVKSPFDVDVARLAPAASTTSLTSLGSTPMRCMPVSTLTCTGVDAAELSVRLRPRRAPLRANPRSA